MKQTKASIHLIAINSDYFFTAEENQETYSKLKNITANIHYHEIDSVHGHDAFLIEFEQLNYFLKDIFK